MKDGPWSKLGRTLASVGDEIERAFGRVQTIVWLLRAQGPAQARDEVRRGERGRVRRGLVDPG